MLKWVEPLMWGVCRVLSNAMQGLGLILFLCAVSILFYRGTNKLIDKEIEKYENQD